MGDAALWRTGASRPEPATAQRVRAIRDVHASGEERREEPVESGAKGEERAGSGGEVNTRAQEVHGFSTNRRVTM
jgi:hypothetical protein